MLSLTKNKISNFHGFCEIYRKSVSMACFFREFARMPAQVGSICPSSRALASVMARCALARPPRRDSLFIDLGAGTGVVSEQLLHMGINSDSILALDISENFRFQFAKNCGNLRLVISDADNLAALVAAKYPDASIHAIISSLPLRVIPEEKTKAIMAAIRQCMGERGGLLIQYTYALWLHGSLRKYGFIPCQSSNVYTNIPPALVEVYKLQQTV